MPHVVGPVDDDKNRVPLFNKHVDYMMSVTAPAKPEPLAVVT